MNDIRSSKSHPCPICNRTKDGKCIVFGSGIITCWVGTTNSPPQDLEPGETITRGDIKYAFLGKADLDMGLKFKVHEPKRKTEPQTWVYADVNREPLVAVHKNPDNKRFWQTSLNGSKRPRDYYSRIYPYRWHEATELLNSGAPYIFWTEGEKDADTLRSLGLAAISTIGGCKNKELSEDVFMSIGAISSQVVVVPDCDKPGWSRLEGLHLRFPHIKTLLPNKAGWDWENLPASCGLDITDWVQSGATVEDILAGIESFNLVDDQRTVQPLSTVDLIRKTFDELLNKYPNDNRTRLVHRCRELVEAGLSIKPTQDLYRRELGEAYLRRDGVEVKPFKAGDLLPTEDLPCLVEGVFIRGALNIIGADPKCGKTLFLVSMLAAMVHNAGTWLGRRIEPPPAVIIIGPDQPSNIWANQLRRANLLPDGRLHPRIVQLWDSTNPWAAGEEGLGELRALCLQHPGCLVVVDSLARVCERLGIDENSTEIGGVISDIERAVVSAGGTPLLVHHNSKGAARNGINGGSALRGSGSIRANASQIASLSLITPDDKRDARRRLTTEGRLGVPIDIVVEADWEQVYWRSICDYAEVRQGLQVEKKRANLTELQEQLVAIVEDTETAVTARWVFQQLNPECERYDAKSSDAKAIYNSLARLVSSGLLSDGPRCGTNRTFAGKVNA